MNQSKVRWSDKCLNGHNLGHDVMSHQYTGIGYRTFKRLNTVLVNLRTVDNDNDNDNRNDNDKS